MSKIAHGIIPVMLTPFDTNGNIDWEDYEKLIEWYLANGAESLFAVCQSSEMQFLSLQERVDLAKFTAEKVAGRVPVVASGHVSDALDDQKAELGALVDTGVDGIVLVSNRLAKADEGSDVLRANLDAILDHLPADMQLGMYECPAPYRRLLTDDEISYCAQTGRFSLLKDVSCDLETVKRRIELTKGTPFGINNANAAIAWKALQAGSTGFCGVFNNIHPDLYRWIKDHGKDNMELAEELAVFLVLSAATEPMGYPKLAKQYHQRIGTLKSDNCRVIDFDIRERFWALDDVMDRVVQGTEYFRAKIAALGAN
ncbi:dihydrodipicolinate synthase family protein [Thalassospira lucentensis]|uniref:dihydrodipicolinate synthase family protein n=1 Tax=Thalassospira lucentensis TaxID=168935 RepID=UPI00142E5D49|nr:dihydrodipicolinate synthase family protein [Thalassospira lucentensis]NIZ01537.1 dihydrodipicolinate synthase family protein [Thalassospira lucentensis]